MLFLQFIIEQTSCERLLDTSDIDLLCYNINDFMKNLPDLTQRFHLKGLAIFEETVILDIFEWMFMWLLSNNYTTYKITLNQHFRKEE